MKFKKFPLLGLQHWFLQAGYVDCGTQVPYSGTPNSRKYFLLARCRLQSMVLFLYLEAKYLCTRNPCNTIQYYTTLCIILYYIVLYYIIFILYYIVLYCIILYYIILYYIILYYIILYCIIAILYYSILYYVILYHFILYHTTLCYIILYYIILYYIMLY